MKQWTLSQSSFDQFLEVLDLNREQAGEKYEALRNRMVKFFEWRGCRCSDDLADETLNRIIRKHEQGVEIEDHYNYAYGVARLVYLEAWKQQTREQPIEVDLPVIPVPDDDDEDMRFSCLERCLNKIPENSRSMILQYYRDDKQAKIDYRKKIAERLNISINALRIKTLRIRAKLEECVLSCLKND